MKNLEPPSEPLDADGAAVSAAQRGAPPTTSRAQPSSLRLSLERARDGLLARQRDDGHWVFEFEADCTIPAEYVLMMHFVDEIDEALQRKIAVYIRARQADHGGWPLYYGGELDISCTVKAYWALKLAGDPIDAPHMERAREAILARGGAARCNVFTRFAMAMFGQVPWRAVPFTPVELILLPRWFPFSYRRVSSWSRLVVVPLTILYSLRATAINPTGIDIRELFSVDPEVERDYFPVRSSRNKLFLRMERFARLFERAIPGFVRRHALKKAERWIIERMNGDQGFGGLFPSMVNAREALTLLGYADDDPLVEQARTGLRTLLIEHDDSAYCQPCVSPVWDTGLAALAMRAARVAIPDPRLDDSLDRAARWLLDHQILDGPADWRVDRPDLEPGGWAFQYTNPHYPDLDDTSAVIWALRLIDGERFAEPIRRALDWTKGMQSSNGGYGAYDIDNDSYYLLDIPFADHGALLDPPTADVTARCLTAFALNARPEDREAYHRCLQFLLDDQEQDGSWFGRWGTNYIYGTWCVLASLEYADDPRVEGAQRRAVAWLKSVQRADGGWGESNDSYFDRSLAGRGQDSTSYQTAWALLAMMAAGERDGPEVRRGIAYLQRTQRDDGLWDDPWYSAPGFPRVFYIRYTGYSAYFPLWALARFYRHQNERTM